MRLKMFSGAVLAGLAILLFSPKICRADAVDTVTLSINVTWTEVGCQTAVPGSCDPIGSTADMTGSFSFDPDTMSFSTGDFASLGNTLWFIQSVSKQTSIHGPDTYTFVLLCDESFNTCISGGSLTISYSAGTWRVLPASVVGFVTEDVGFQNQGGTHVNGVEWQVPTPEPGTLALLATGLLGLAPLIRRRITI